MAAVTLNMVRIDRRLGESLQIQLYKQIRRAIISGALPPGARLPKDKVMVTYCWGPGCNSSTKGALRLAALGFRVKELIGGLEYWIKGGGRVEGKLEPGG